MCVVLLFAEGLLVLRLDVSYAVGLFCCFSGLLQGPGQGKAAAGAHHHPREDVQQARRAQDQGSRRSLPLVGLIFRGTHARKENRRS